MTTATYTPEQVTEMLRAGATYSGTNTTRAATHLLLFLDLAHTNALQKVIFVDEVYGPGGVKIPAAFVENWAALLRLLGKSSGAQCLLTVAVALATGRPVDLVKWLPRAGGKEHARALAEAMNIAIGYDEWYQITPTAKLAEHEQWQRELLAEN